LGGGRGGCGTGRGTGRWGRLWLKGVKKLLPKRGYKADLLGHADDEALLLDVIRLNGLVILQNLSRVDELQRARLPTLRLLDLCFDLGNLYLSAGMSGAQVMHLTVSDGSASTTNFCCLRSYPSQHMKKQLRRGTNLEGELHGDGKAREDEEGEWVVGLGGRRE
jgi:hypothetical protein